MNLKGLLNMKPSPKKERISKAIRGIENLNAPEIDLERTFSLNEFAEAFGARYNLSKTAIIGYVRNYEFPGVAIEKKDVNNYFFLTPASSRWFKRIVETKLAKGEPMSMILPYRKGYKAVKK
jgi:hypothetical protein